MIGSEGGFLRLRIPNLPIRVYIVEDHEVMREALIDFLNSSEGLEVCGSSASAEEALPDVLEKDPDVAVLDPLPAGKEWPKLLEDIRAQSSIPCLILSGHSERGHVERAVAAGANGYLRKGFPDELAAAILTVAEGGAYLPECAGAVEAPKH